MPHGFQVNWPLVHLLAGQFLAGTVAGAAVSWFYPRNLRLAEVAALGAIFLVLIVAMIRRGQLDLRRQWRWYALQTVIGLPIALLLVWTVPDAGVAVVAVYALGAAYVVTFLIDLTRDVLGESDRPNDGDERPLRLDRVLGDSTKLRK
jgi:hypothetical protein